MRLEGLRKAGGLVKRLARAGIATACAAATLAVGVVSAQAVQITGGAAGMPGYTSNAGFSVTLPGGETRWGETGIGPVARTDGRFAYCMEANSEFAGTAGSWSDLSGADASKLAYLADKHNGDSDDLVQAAIAYLVHMKIDNSGGAEFMNAFAAAGLRNGSWDQVVSKAAELWADAEANMPADVQAEYRYTSGKRSGVVDPGIKNASGGYVSGVAVTITDLNNTVHFDDTGTSSITTTTTGGPQNISWTAVKTGTAKFRFRYTGVGAKKLASANQDLFSAGDPRQIDGGSIEFRVQKDFQPSVSTRVVSKELSRGETVRDVVTSGVDQSGDNAGGEWADGVTVNASGYYYTLPAKDAEGLSVFAQSGTVAAPEDPSAYLARVAKEFGEPVATGSASFTGAGQSVEVTAKSADGSDFVNPEDGLVGTWVWVIDRAVQPDKDFVTASWIHEFGQAVESDVHTSVLSGWSEVAEPHAELDSDVRDVIHMSGLPDDFGEFKGNDGLGLSADDTEFQVQVWWAGASGANAGVREEDEKFKPSTSEPPAEDANHKLVRTVTYDLKDLIDLEGKDFDGRLDIRVGGGDAGSPLADGSHFSVTAESTGYYVFTAKYAGCSRLSAWSSPYDDAFEATFVTTQKPSIDLTSDVTPESVKVGEAFADVAHISGTGSADGSVTEGAYVVFDAYVPVPGKPDVSVGKLLDSDRHVLTADQVRDLNAGRPVDVTSTAISASSAGNVYWQAALYTAGGTLLATHELGVKSETTKVQAGGEIASSSQSFGSVGQSIWDDITVSDGLSGNVPDGAYAVVRAYYADKQPEQTDDSLFFERRVDIDTARLTTEDGSRGGSYTFRVETGAEHAPDRPGMVYWTHALFDSHGELIDEGEFGEQSERTVVQEFSTTVSKKVVSANLDEYSAATVQVYDALRQTAYVAGGQLAQTPKGATYQFEVWEQSDGDVAGDRMVWSGDSHALPLMAQAGNTDASKASQLLKSETVTVGKDWSAGTHYFRVKVLDRDGNVVYYAPQRIADESFEVVRVTSTAAEKVVTTDMAHVQDVLHVEGTLPKGSVCQVEIWSLDSQGNPVKKVSESEKVTLDADVTDADITGPVMDNPSHDGEAASWQFRHRVWSPDGLGGDPDIGADSGMLDDDWEQGDGYAQRHLIFEGRSDAERFEAIRISTRVAGTMNTHVVDGSVFVNVTDGVQVADHAMIDGVLPDGYRLGFELFRRDAGDDAARDVLVATVPAVDLAAGTTELDSAPVTLDSPDDLYWVTVFTKADGTSFMPDGQSELRSDRRIESESFHAARVTTTTAKWSSAGGQATDTALIEGCLPTGATITFALHDYATGETVATTEDRTLAELGYQACQNGQDRQTVESDPVTVPAAKDHYWVETVRLPDGSEFHRGDERVDHESTRTISVTTETHVEAMLGDAISDLTSLDNIRYSTGSAADIRDDLTGPLTASWEVWRQGDGDESTDTLLTTLADGEQAVALESGQTTVSSPNYRPDQLGIHYFRVVIRDEAGNVVAYGAAREPAESIRIVDASSATDEVIEQGGGLHDRVTISGPVAEGTMVSWDIFNTGDGAADADELVARWDTPATGAYIITAEDAATALRDGKITITSPLAYAQGEAGDQPYFVFSLTAPKRGETGEPVKPVKGEDGVYTIDHLEANGLLPIGDETVDGDDAEPQTVPTPFFTDVARDPAETSSVIKVTTKASTHEATVGDDIHDVALIEGHVPAGYCIRYEYWSQSDGDVADDRLVETTDCVAVTPGATSVTGPTITASHAGAYYWRERLLHEETERQVTYGRPRVPDETVTVTRPPLPVTGMAVAGAAGVLGALLAGGLALAGVARRRSASARHRG